MSYKGYKRGQIVYVTGEKGVGCEMWPNRAAVIVSSDKTNEQGLIASVIYLKSKNNDKPLRQYNIDLGKIFGKDAKSTIAICEQPVTVDASRITKYMGDLDKEKLVYIEDTMLDALGIQFD